MSRSALLALLTLCMGVAACSANVPRAAPSSPAPPTTRSSPAAPRNTGKSTPPPMPALARQHTNAGAKAFVEHVWATINYAQTEVDASPLRALFSSFCDGCRGAERFIRHVEAAHGRILGGRNRISRVAVTRLSAGAQHPFAVRFVVANTAENVRFSDGTKDEQYAAARTATEFILSATHSSWVVTTWNVKS